MRPIIFAALSLAFSGTAVSGQDASADSLREANKALARAFYEDLWFSSNTDRFADYVADTYVVHDIDDRKNVTESAVEQKNIADFFWENGTLSGAIDFQIAEGDLVATRWQSRFEPSTLVGRIMNTNVNPDGNLPIINVLRIRDGKIVEFWNHRHDINTGQTLKFVAQGFGLGLLVSLIPLWYALALRRRLKASAPSGP